MLAGIIIAAEKIVNAVNNVMRLLDEWIDKTRSVKLAIATPISIMGKSGLK